MELFAAALVGMVAFWLVLAAIGTVKRKPDTSEHMREVALWAERQQTGRWNQ